MSDTADFLNALFGPYDGDITFQIDGVDTTTASAATAAAEEGAAVYLLTRLPGDKACFAYGIAEDVEPAEWREFQRQPTVALFRETDGTKGMLIAFWAMESPFPLADVQPLLDAFGSDADEPVPLPDVNGWRLIECSDSRFYALEELLQVYAAPADAPAEGELDISGHDPAVSGQEPEAEIAQNPDDVREGQPDPAVSGQDDEGSSDVAGHKLDTTPVEDTLPWEEEPARFWGNAQIMTAGWNPEADPRFATPTMIAQGARADSANWKTKTLPLGAILAQMCQHMEGVKDGPGFVGGEVIGERRKAVAMKQLTFVGLDIDTGKKPEEIDAVLAARDELCLRYTTHSNAKTSTEFLKSKVVKFAQDKGYDATDISVDLLKEFMTEVGKFETYVVDSVDEVDEDQTEKGFIVRVGHCPIPKNRILFPLATPYVMAKEAAAQKQAIEKWKKVPAALARELGVPIDTTGVDPSRLFYYPRHKKGRPFEVVIFGGAKLFDWRTLELDDPYAAVAAEMDSSAGKRKSKTSEGQALGKWSIAHAQGFQIADLIREHAEDRIRAEVSSGMEIECPFDEDHSNAGDTEDRACLVTNAGEGPSEIFTISCRHESCQGRTNLDMLGKMIKDGWFAEEVIWDENLNALASEDTAQPEAAKKIVDEHKAKRGLPDMIAELTKESPYEQVKLVCEEAGKASADGQELKFNLEAIRATGVKLTVRDLKALSSKTYKPKTSEGTNVEDAKFDNKLKKHVWKYYSSFNSDDAVRQCVRILKQANEKMPMFTCTLDQPVRMKEDDEGRLSYPEYSNTQFWSEMCKRLAFQRKTDQGDGPREQVPKDIAAELFNTAYDILPATPEVIYTPIYTEAGTLLREAGWNRELGVVMADTGFDVPEVYSEPTDEEVASSLAFLREEVLDGFPFLDYGNDGFEKREASEANALAMLITPFMRRMIRGCTPVFFIAKPTPGTGGTLLGTVPMLLFDGEVGFPMPYYKDNDDEMRKALISAIMETRSFLFFDDVTDFNSRVLLQSITARKIGGRILGRSLNAEKPNTFIWIATGNNPYIKNEMERRICRITLNAKSPDIQTRQFRHADYPGFILANRAKIVHCILTLIQSWIAKGMPRFTERKLVSFEEWGAMVGGVIGLAWPEHAFLDNRRPPSADQDQASTRQFVGWWLKKWGFNDVSQKDLFTKAVDEELDIIEGSNDDQKKYRFTRKLNQLEGQTFVIDDSTVISRSHVDKGGTSYYTLVRQDAGDRIDSTV